MERKKVKWIVPLIVVTCMVYLIGLIAVHLNQRAVIFLPSHGVVENSPLEKWTSSKGVIGFKREVDGASRIWFMMHGNAGQAAHRSYVLPHLPESDSFFVLEYPGYGKRPGAPYKDSFNSSAEEAYQVLRETHPEAEIVVVGESIGSGPASHLATTDHPPARIVLITPFDSMINLASHHAGWFPASLIIKDDWDNIKALEDFNGQLQIFGALQDRITPFMMSKRLAESVKGAVLIELDCDHNDWMKQELVLK